MYLGNWLQHLTIVLAIACTLEARRVRVQQVQDDDIQYYDPQEQGQVVLVASDDYNGIYGQQAAARSSAENYPTRQRLQEPQLRENKPKDQSKAPPVQTIRNYNKVNDDGSFTFGYEAADGSFKEETRGTDCVVRGKYGYIDPDGNKREFTYVSGNPCDPNAKNEEASDEKPEEESAEPENVPANYPVRPIRPIPRPVPTTPAPRPAVTVFQNTYQDERSEVEQPEPEQVLRPTIQPVVSRHRVLPTRPAYIPEERPAPVLIQQRPRVYQQPATTPAPIYREQPTARPVTIAPKPQPTPARQLPATTYRPQLLQVAVTPRPALLYTKQVTQPLRTTHFPSSTPASVSHASAIDFAAEFQKFTHDNHLHPSTPSPVTASKPALHTNVQQSTSNPIYSSELVFDPSSGQYNTAIYQTLPQTEGDFSLNHRIQPYVQQPQPQLVSLRELQQQSPLYRQLRPNQATYQQQQAEIQFQNSQQLFAQQQRARQQQQQHRPIGHSASQRGHAAQSEPQQFYYIQPSVLQSQTGLAGGQIDAFLRGHNIQF